jgi:predicted transcriptional regulator
MIIGGLINMLNEILKELGISKVRLAKYLGVSRQMVYNYLEIDNIDEWPKDKKMRLYMLLDIKNAEEIKSIKPNTEYILKVEKTLNNNDFSSLKSDSTTYDFRNLNKKQQQVLTDVIELMKELLSEDETGNTTTIFKYLYHYLQLISDVEELKYVLAYFAKANGFITPKEFAFNEDNQITFEGIMYQAMSLFNNGGASKNKIIEAHKRFVAEIQYKQEEKLSRTQELNTAKVQALKELGYTEINESNAAEVFEKIAEIQSRTA